MTKVLWKKIMDQLADLKFCGRIGPHFYNEPLLDKRLPELIEYARAVMPFCWLQINSNGDLLNEKIMLELYRHGVNFFFITNYDEEDKPELQLLEADYPALIKVVKNSEMWRTDRGGKIFHKEKILNSPCLRPASQLVVNWEGKVLLCCMDYYAQYSFGDLKQQSLRKIWHNTRFTETKHNIALSRQKGLTICHKCDDPGFIPW
jgi:radical SAM protein with 4Fe4S-binding SPASM domain